MRSDLANATPRGDAALSLVDLATAINQHHAEANQHARSALEHAYHAGELLLTAKCQVGHGGWLPWLERNCCIGDRQARKYMALAKGDLSIVHGAIEAGDTINQTVAKLAKAKRPKSAQPKSEPGADLPKSLPAPAVELPALPSPLPKAASATESSRQYPESLPQSDAEWQQLASEPVEFWRAHASMMRWWFDGTAAEAQKTSEMLRESPNAYEPSMAISDAVLLVSSHVREALWLLDEFDRTEDARIVAGPVQIRYRLIRCLCHEIEEQINDQVTPWNKKRSPAW